MADGKDNDKILEHQEEEEDLDGLLDNTAVAKEIQDDISQQMVMHFSKLEDDVRNVFSQRMETIESNLSNQFSERVSNARSDVLKTNKVFREICRPLGSRWKELYTILTSGMPRDVVTAEINVIEKQTPLMQPYKSLMSWKEMKGSSFNVEELIDALKSINLNELSEKVDTILHRNSADDLFDMSSFGKSLDGAKGTASAISPRTHTGSTQPRTFRGSTTKQPTSSETGNDVPALVEGTSELPIPQNPQAPSSSSSSPALPGCASDAVQDRQLLMLAKKIPDAWDKLAKFLKVPQEDISDILASEGGLNYQGAFRMLWIWRESRSDEAEKSVDLLTSALNQLGRADLAALFKC